MIHKAEPGEAFYSFLLRIKKEMVKHHADCEFNDITFTVYQDSNLSDLCLIYGLKSEIRRIKSKEQSWKN